MAGVAPGIPDIDSGTEQRQDNQQDPEPVWDRIALGYKEAGTSFPWWQQVQRNPIRRDILVITELDARKWAGDF